jgi:hypothetical protein
MSRFTLAIAVVALLAATASVQPGAASQLIDRNATDVKLVVDSRGEALITYRAAGQLKHVLAWGAVNAVAPSEDAKQVAFKLDYSGGYGKYRVNGYFQPDSSANWVCLPYDGPELALEVAACKAPDGSYWALQSWQRALPDLGVGPTPAQSAPELHLSHWTGALPVLSITVDWAYRKYDHLFGTFSYEGMGVYGFKSTPAGAPLDSFGRNIYVDTFNSAYGPGWKRENSFLTHGPDGSFCYGFFPHGASPAGAGIKYRATVEGPGVTPDVMWQEPAPGPFNATTEAADRAQLKAIGDPHCTVG